MNGCDGIVERRDKPLSLQELCNKDATGLDIRPLPGQVQRKSADIIHDWAASVKEKRLLLTPDIDMKILYKRFKILIYNSL
jgi:hypothetical protein